jgi:MGT family glycosyltransferase
MVKKSYNFVFLTIPAFGHINPMLPIITELVKQGHKVTVYNNSEFEKIIRETGAEFRLPPINIETPDLKEFKDNFKIAEKGLEVTKIAVPSMIKIFEKERPDCIIHDSLTPWGKIISQYLKIPAVSLVPSMAINLSVIFKSKINKEAFLEIIGGYKRFFGIYQQFKKIYKQYGLKTPLVFDIFSNKEKLNIVFTSRSVQIDGSSFKSDYKFVGPSIYKRKDPLLRKDLFNKKEKIIYISLGTIFNDDLNFYKICFEVFKNSNVMVFMSIGNDIKKSDLGKIPDNFYVEKYLPQLQILEKADLFLTHSGMNSINESLYHGVPMIIFPQQLEQKANAYQIEELGAGIINKKKLTKFTLSELIKNIYSNNYKNNAAKLGESLRKCGGYKEATRLIIEYIDKKTKI